VEGSQSFAGRPHVSLPLAALWIALARPSQPLCLSIFSLSPVADRAYLLVLSKALSH
jgi:hypothetical protein